MCYTNWISHHPVILLLVIIFVTCAETQGGEEFRVISDSQDDKLISQLLLNSTATGGSNQGHDTEVARILKALEVKEQTSSTISPPTPTPSTSDASPFFKTERPFSTRISKRSHRHHHHHSHFLPPVHSLLWNSAQAVWHVSRPVFYRTPVGRAVSLAYDTATLPIRALGAVRHTVHNLYHDPHTPSSIWNWGWNSDSDDHHHHHGDHDLVYIKQKPDNSLFRSWLRYLYHGIRPAIATKLWLKQRLLRIQLRLAALALHKRLHHLRNILFPPCPKVVLVKDHYHHDSYHEHHPTPPVWEWLAPSPPPPPQQPEYGPPNYQPLTPVHADLTYGPAYEWTNAYGDYQRKTGSSSQEPHPPQTTPLEEEMPLSQANSYADPPSPWLTAPGVVAPENILSQGSEPSSARGEAFAKYVNQFVADRDPKSLTATSLFNEHKKEEIDASGVNLLRILRSNSESSGEVPILVPEDQDEQVLKISWRSPRSAARTL